MAASCASTLPSLSFVSSSSSSSRRFRRSGVVAMASVGQKVYAPGVAVSEGNGGLQKIDLKSPHGRGGTIRLRRQVAEDEPAAQNRSATRPETARVGEKGSRVGFSLMEGEEDNFLSDILQEGEDSHVAGSEELAVPNTQENGQASRGTKGTRRSKNFQYKEDELVCLGWLKVSKDPEKGANQSRSTFWGRVCAYYDEHNDTGVVRTESSIMHRWLTIQFQVNKFCAAYDAIKRRNQSGTTTEDRINDAKKLYTDWDKDKKTFTLDHCWKILKEEDKWKLKMAELAELEKISANKKKQKGAKVSRPREQGATNNDQVVAVDGEEPEPRKRSDGIKKVKENHRRGGGEAAMAAMEKMWAKKEEYDKEKEKAKQERFMASLAVDKEALELEKKRADADLKRAEADLLKEEKEIMMACNGPLQQQWLEMMQQRIVDRRQGNST